MGIGLKDIIAKLNGGASTPTSCRSSDTPDEPSMSPTSLSEGDGDLPFTIGVTDATPHACHFCDKAFHRHQHLKLHEQEHTNKMKFECPYCQRQFKHKRSRDRHVKLHTGDRKYKCANAKCDAAFSRSDHLKIHMKTHENGKPYPCTICGRGYSTAASLTSHISSHKKEQAAGKGQPPPDRPFRCLSCHAHFTTSQELQEHGLTHQDGQTAAKTLRCSFCSENFSSTVLLREHVEANHVPETQGRCSICNATFQYLENLLRHKKVHMEEAANSGCAPTSPFRFNCHRCHKVCASEDALRRHLRTHRARLIARSTSSPLSNPRTTPEASSSPSSSTPYACEYCTMKFTVLRDLQQHTLAVHCHRGNTSKDGVYCTLCHTSFADTRLFMEHEKLVHEKDNITRPHQDKNTKSPRNGNPRHPFLSGSTLYPYGCNLCYASMSTFSEFTEHVKCHLAPYPSPLVCSMCGERTFSEELYLVHVSGHFRSLVSEYSCQGCSKEFSEPDSLQGHLMEQHAHQLFRCTVCSQVLESKVDLQLHFSTSHSSTSRVFKCSSCKEVCRNELDFQVHVKLVHMGNHPAFRCPLCNQCFASEPEFSLHYQTHMTFSCTYCGDEFQVEFLLDRHVQEEHSKEVMIPFPGREANVAQDLSLKASPSKGTHKCDLCDATFAVESALNVHRSQAHNNRASASQKQGQTTLSLDCAYCHEPFKSRTELANHTKSHCVSSSKHKCNICDELFPSAATLSEHKLSHLKVETYRSCVVCHLSLRDEQDFYAHFHEHNVDNIPAPCVICRQTLLTTEDVEVHARHHLKIQDTCCVCGKNVPTQMMIIHGTSESHSFMCKDCFRSNEMENRCNECSLKFENPEELSKHKSSHLGSKNLECLKCQLVLKSVSDAQQHVHYHLLQEGNDHKCHLCETILNSPAKLQCHLIDHSFEGASSYRCYLCSSVFTGSHLLQKHMVQHSPKDKTYRCEFCHLSFFFRTELDNHMHGHSEFRGSQFDIYRCPDCNQTFPSQRDLQLHSKIHEKLAYMQHKLYQTAEDSEERKFRTAANKHPCHLCKESFNRYKDLKLHLRTHSKAFECGSCKRSFISNEQLLAHQEKHRHYPCEQCGKRFATEELVTEHMRLHITSTTHPCEMCSETFESLAKLKEHLVASHDKQFEHSCPVCNEVFESSEALELHLQKEHPVPMDVESAESISGQSTSSSGNTKDGDSSECSSNMEESDTRDSPLSVTETHAVSQAVS